MSFGEIVIIGSSFTAVLILLKQQLDILQRNKNIRRRVYGLRSYKRIR